jgi:hypothetical protein
MAIRYGLALAAVMLAMAASGARACDDFEDEMALAGAREAVKAGQMAADGRAPIAGAETLASSPAQATIAVAAEPPAAPRRAPTEPARTLAQ